MSHVHVSSPCIREANTCGVVKEQHACVSAPGTTVIVKLVSAISYNWSHTDERHDYRSNSRPPVKVDYHWIGLWLIQRLNEQVMQMSGVTHIIGPTVPVGSQVSPLSRQR